MPDTVSGYRRRGLLTNLIQPLRAWAKTAEERELDQCGDDIRRIAADAGLTTADLSDLVSRGDNAAALLPDMMAALNLDPAATPRDVLRDLQRVCSLCSNKSECACALARGSADTTYVDFCPNADTLRALQLAVEQEPGGSPRSAG